MEGVATSDETGIVKLVKQLCTAVTGLKNDAVQPHFTTALVIIGGNLDTSRIVDEFDLVEKIKKKFVRQKKEKDAVLFSELNRKLRAQLLLKERGSILSLLYALSDTSSSVSNTTGEYRGVSLPSSSFSSRRGFSAAAPTPSMLGLSSMAAPLAHSSGFSSVPDSYRSVDPSPLPKSLQPRLISDLRGISLVINVSICSQPFRKVSGVKASACLAQMHNMFHSINRLPYLDKTPFVHHGLQPAGDRTVPSLGLKFLKTFDRSEPLMGSSRSNATLQLSQASANSRFSVSEEVPDATLLKEVIFAFQGIEGKYIKYDAISDAFGVDAKVGVSKPVRKTINKLAECGLLFGKVRKFADKHSVDRSFGLVGQSFCAALHQELTEYYRLIAVLAAQLQQEEDQGVVVCSAGGSLTFRRLAVWMCEPLVRLKTLAALVEVCEGKKGGALASTVHSYMNHGDPAVQTLVRHLLSVVVQPIFTTILRWIYEGELDDPHQEFFVAADTQVKDDRLWNDKYSLRTEMIPSFLSIDQAKKILLTGKAINLLRQVCQDRTLIRSREAVRVAETSQVETMFSRDLDGVFDKMVDTVYRETSQHLLHVLHTKYKFMDHLKAMRRYLLLGQGDFIRHLMDLLEEDLAKPAQTLFLHNLTGILETAVRATNAQYDDPDILTRLDVRLLEVSPGDAGWDVFSLEYHVSGHIRTVFTAECMMMYLRVFNFLWRAKRMEYVLSMIWKEQMANAKLLRSISELQPALHQCQLIVSEMLHFIQQVQYYINFEVLECSWDELLKKVKDAGDLDHIIAAHQEFLDTITTRSLLDSQSHEILTQLRTIFDLIINFQSIQETMYHGAKEELLQRQNYEQCRTVNTNMGTWGLDTSEEEAEERRRIVFRKTMLSSSCSQLRILHKSYQNMVQRFLMMLTKHADVNLRFLSFRLDFNEHYHALQAKHKLTGPRRTTEQRK